MQMCNQAFHDVFEADIIALRIDDNSVLGDVIYIQVL